MDEEEEAMVMSGPPGVQDLGSNLVALVQGIDFIEVWLNLVTSLKGLGRRETGI